MSRFVVTTESRAFILEAQESDWDADSDPRKIVKWSKTAEQLSGGQRSKAIKLCDFKCIQYAGDGEFVSLPIDTNKSVFFRGRTYDKVPFEKDYNRDPTPYVLRKVGGEWTCSCQWSVKMRLPCAHILALKIEFKRKKFNNPEKEKHDGGDISTWQSNDTRTALSSGR